MRVQFIHAYDGKWWHHLCQMSSTEDQVVTSCGLVRSRSMVVVQPEGDIDCRDGRCARQHADHPFPHDLNRLSMRVMRHFEGRTFTCLGMQITPESLAKDAVCIAMTGDVGYGGTMAERAKQILSKARIAKWDGVSRWMITNEGS